MTLRPSRLALQFAVLLFGWFFGVCIVEGGYQQPSIEELEGQLANIEQELAQTAQLTLRSGVGNVGWFSQGSTSPNHPASAEIKLPAASTFDRIVLVPVLWNDAEQGPQADGFPEAFRIIAGTEDFPEGRVICERDNRTQPFLPRIAPLMIELPPTTANWIRIESTRLGPQGRDERMHRFKLAELMVFSGENNIALNQPVQASSVIKGWGAAAISKEALVDGLTPYLMNSAKGERSNPFMTCSKRGTTFVLTIDLGAAQPIEGIRLHSAELSEYVPQINSSDFGMPKAFTVSGSLRSDFEQAPVILSYQRDSIYQAGNILEWKFSQTHCRYLRLRAPPEAWPLDAAQEEYLLSLAEVEVLSDSRNIARDKKVFLGKAVRVRANHLLSITDGRNHFGSILPTKEWMIQLSRRHELEQERPIIAQALQQQYADQKSKLRLLSWLVALLIGCLIIIVLAARMLRLRAVMKVRERLAANLHDEISANLHALVLLGDMAEENLSQPEPLREIVQKIKRVSIRNRSHARHCMDQLQADSFVPDLERAMRRTADRLLANHSHHLTFEGHSYFIALPQRKKNDLFLFYQECLVNIARHARASSLTVSLRGSAKRIELIVSDNGKGLSEIPASLARRARLLRARVSLEDSSSEGATLRLTLRNRKKSISFSRKLTND